MFSKSMVCSFVSRELFQHYRCFNNVVSTTTVSINKNTIKSYEEIPGPKCYPIIGTSWIFFPYVGFADVHRLPDMNRELLKRYGPIWKTEVGDVKMVAVTDVEDVETIIRSEDRTPTRPFFLSMRKYREINKHKFNKIGVGIMNGPEWREFRSQVQPVLMKPKGGAVSQYIDQLEFISDDFLNRMRQTKDPETEELPNDFNNDLYKWALESVCLVALDTRLGCLNPNLPKDSDGQRLIDAVNGFFHIAAALEMSFPFWKYLSTPKWRQFVKHQDVIYDVAMKHVEKILTRIDKKVNSPEEASDQTAVVMESLLLQRNVKPEDAVVMIIDMLMGGVDTTSHAMSFVMYSLARNPEKQEKLYEELRRLMPDKNTRVCNGLIDEMKYMKACIKETMRMLPVVTGTARQLTKDTVLSGYKVPKDTLCILNIQLMGSREDYFPSSDKFLPERWLPGGHQIHNPFAFLPFGHGTRMCIGRRIAETELWILTAKLVRNFRIEYNHDDLGVLSRLVNYPDKPLNFALHEREN